MMRVRIGIGIALPMLALSTTAIVFAAHSPIAQFTADQASRGRTTYTIQCSACHGADLGGVYAPALAGSASKISLQPPGAVYGYTSVYMPAGNAGALKQRDYVDIMAFLMQQNGRHPSGTPLTIKAIQGDPMPMAPTH
jgi:polar amino acid transport system substrate-binding protein